MTAITSRGYIVDGGGRYAHISFDRPADLMLRRPGHYVELVVPEHVGTRKYEKVLEAKQYCVIASATDDEVSFMVKRDSKLFSALESWCGWTGYHPEVGGGTIEMSAPRGGFDVSDVRGRTVICFAAGTGIAGIVPILEDFKRTHDVMESRLYYSETKGEFGFRNVLDRSSCRKWLFTSEGVLSANPHVPILGMIAQLTGQAPITFPERPIVYVCGGKDYADRLREALVPVHVHPDDFRLNL